MRVPFLREHLHNQIVLPLLVAAVVVGALATAVAVYLLSDLTDKWVDAAAQSAVDNLDARLDMSMETMVDMAELVSKSRELEDAIRGGDAGRVSAVLAVENLAVESDGLILFDESGTVVGASGGRIQAEVGDRPLGAEQGRWADLSMSHPVYLKLYGADTLTALQRFAIGGRTYTLAHATVFDDRFLSQVSKGIDASFCFYGQDKSLVACSVSPEDAVASPALLEAMRAKASPIREAVGAASSDAPGKSRLQLEDGDFHIVAREVAFPGDPTRSTRYIVAEVSTKLSEQAASTTTRLIMMWSVAAVVALVGLGGWVASSVTQPLVALSDGARRLAEGDFDTKVEVSGANEVSELAESFNQMTDSLKDRTESLTKKVLELATLYEMSRSLGSTLDLNQLLESVLDSAMRIFDVELGYITLRERDTGRLELRVRRGSGHGRADDQAIRSSMSDWVIREGRPLIFNPPPDTDAKHQVDSVTGALAALCVPLVSGDSVLGAITVGSHDASVRFVGDDVRLLSTIANHVSMAVGNIELFSSLQDAYLATVRSLAAAVDAKDSYTRGHSDTVAFYATAVAERLGLSQDQQTALEMAAYLHDIGKIGVKEEILLKAGRLTDDEMGQMRHHPLIGANILKPVAFPWSIAPVVRHHHERWDGQGYPAGLKGEEIPLLARILTVADSFEAMVSDRPYRPGRTIDEAIEEVRHCSGTQFDPRVADAFIQLLEDGLIAELDITARGEEEAQPDEVRAIFVAICDGMFDSFRRLGGPRLAANLEQELNEHFRDRSLPFVMSSGHMSVWFDDTMGLDDEVRLMSDALAAFGAAMERTSGQGLVEHFYSEALMELSERMRRLAAELELRPAS